MSEEENSPLAPAAALLFQAPQFQEPAPKEQQRGPQEEPGDKLSGDENASGGKRKPAKGARQGQKKSEQGKNEESKQQKQADSRKTEDPKQQKKSSSGKKKSKSTSEEPAKEGTPSAKEPDAKRDEGGGTPEETTRRRRRRRPRGASSGGTDTDPNDEVQALKGSTRLEAKRMRRREGRKEGRRRQSITEAEFLARRESVDREMVVRHQDGLDQIAVLEDGLLVEHYVARRTQQSIVGNIYLGRVQNVLPSMEAAFVDIGRGRNAVLYAGEVNWDSLGMEGKPRRIEQALKSGDTVLVQVTKDPIGHKGARLTSQITLAGRYLVLVPGSSMLGISRKLPDTERSRLKKILREVVPEDAGVIVRTAAEGATEQQLKDDVERLVGQWKDIGLKQERTRKAPQLLRGEPELVVRVVRDIFNEDFAKLVVEGSDTWETVHEYVTDLSPELEPRLEKWTGSEDVFKAKRIDEQLAKGMDRKVWLPSGGTLVIDRTEALTVVDVNTGKFIGSGGTLEETVTRNNLEAAEEIVRQLRLRDIGGIIIIDFVDMVLESNRELVLRRLVESLGRDRTRHQVTEITSLGLVQMTRKRVGEGLVEAFSTTCEHCDGRGFVVHDHPVEVEISTPQSGGRRRKGKSNDDHRSSQQHKDAQKEPDRPVSHVGDEKVKTALSAIAAATVRPEDEGEPEKETESKAGPESAAIDGDRDSSSGGKRSKAKAQSSKAQEVEAQKVKTQEPTASTSVAEEPPVQESKARDHRADEAKAHESKPQRSAPRRRRAATVDAVTPAERPVAEGSGQPQTRAAGKGSTVVIPGAAESSGVVQVYLPERTADAPSPRRRRKVTSGAGGVTPKVQDSPEEAAAKRESAQEAVKDLLDS